jgi:hypothetical protein
VLVRGSAVLAAPAGSALPRLQLQPAAAPPAASCGRSPPCWPFARMPLRFLDALLVTRALCAWLAAVCQSENMHVCMHAVWTNSETMLPRMAD